MNQEQINNLKLEITKNYGNTAGFIIIKDGIVEFEEYFNGLNKASGSHIFSVTKSILSLLIGIAIDKGYIQSVNQKVLEFFPDYIIKKREYEIQNVTLAQLLTMTAPFKYKFAPYTKYFKSEDWVKASLDLLGGKKSMGEFVYRPLIGPDILSGILVHATGQSVLSFAQENLFEPLGIKVEGNVTFANKEEQMAFYKAKETGGWVADPKGINTAGWGLSLTAQDLSRIGLLCLNDGMYNDIQVVSKKWMAQCMCEHSRWEKINLAYGYLWWLPGENGNEFAAMGDGGNIIYGNKEKNLVIASTCLFVPRAKDRLDFINQIISAL